MRSALALFVSVALVTVGATGCRRHHDRGAKHGNDYANNAYVAPPPPAADPPPPDPNAPTNVVSDDGTFVCPGGSVVQGDGCACPAGTSWIAEQCQSCPGGSVAQGDACVCPSNTSWTGTACQQIAVASPAAPVQPPPPERPRPSKRSAWIPRPPDPPAPPNVQVNIPVVVGNVGNVTNISRGTTNPSTPTQPPPSSSPPSTGGRSVPANTRVTVAECRNGMVRAPNGIACQCPQGQEWGGSQCVITCHPTQVRRGNQCTCPKDTRWNGSRCELWQECRAGEVRIGASCLPASAVKKR